MDSPPGDMNSKSRALRRETMRAELLEQMHAHHRRRRTRRHVASTAALLLATGLLFTLVLPRLVTRPGELAESVSEPRPEKPVIEYHVVSTRRAVTDKYIVPPVSRIQRIDDSALMENLIALNRPAGLIRTGEKVWLTSPVTDEIQP